MGLPNLPFARYLPSRQLIAGDHINKISDLTTSFEGSITALAGGALSALTPILNAAFCELTTVASVADSVVLPKSQVGLIITVTNSGSNAAQVFANGTDTINGTAGNVGVALAAAATARYVCTKLGVWKRFVSA